jgi:hypothetical protein
LIDSPAFMDCQKSALSSAVITLLPFATVEQYYLFVTLALSWWVCC